MSHFTVAVIGKNLDEEAIAKAMAPYHEFECTGRNDEYVQTVDITEEARQKYEADTEKMIVYADGTRESAYAGDAWLSRPATAEEIEQIKTKSCGVDFKFRQKGYGENSEYSVLYLPEGAEEKTLPTSDVMPFDQFAASYYGVSDEVLNEGEEADTESEHKYGYIIRMNDGSFKVFDRTNPNAKWDWYQIGGRWNGMLKAKHGATGIIGEKSWASESSAVGYFDVMKKGDIDLEGMRQSAIDVRRKAWEKTCEKVRNLVDSNLTENEIDDLRNRNFELWDSAVATFTDENADKLGASNVRDYYTAKYGEQALSLAMIFVGYFESNVVSSKGVQNIEDWINSAPAFTTYAVIHENTWFQKGEMGWFGMSNDEMTEDEWVANYIQLINRLEDDDMIAIVDCHI